MNSINNYSHEVPTNLYIPPNALEIMLEVFAGPLDLLLYLIKKDNIDILEIPIATITEQYMEYMAAMENLHFELAADYLEMAAMLAEIKSKMLLPRPVVEGEEVEDPRAELIRKLLEYEQIKQAASNLNKLPREGRDTNTIKVTAIRNNTAAPKIEVSMQELLNALQDVMKRSNLTVVHSIKKETVTIRDCMSRILAALKTESQVAATRFINGRDGKLGVVVTFVAILELLKNAAIELVQQGAFAPIYIRQIEC